MVCINVRIILYDNQDSVNKAPVGIHNDFRNDLKILIL